MVSFVDLSQNFRYCELARGELKKSIMSVRFVLSDKAKLVHPIAKL